MLLEDLQLALPFAQASEADVETFAQLRDLLHTHGLQYFLFEAIEDNGVLTVQSPVKDFTFLNEEFDILERSFGSRLLIIQEIGLFGQISVQLIDGEGL